MRRADRRSIEALELLARKSARAAILLASEPEQSDELDADLVLLDILAQALAYTDQAHPSAIRQLEIDARMHDRDELRVIGP